MIDTVSDLRVFERFSDAVGMTPMVRLHRVVEELRCEVWAKLEFLNPMGSIKDRMARHVVERALEDGKIEPGGCLVESSSGNTAMGLALMAVERGLTCRIVVRKQTSKEKLDCLRALGVELILVDGDLPSGDPESYNRKASALAAETPGAFFPDQHNNRLNNDAHYRTTGPEIWRQMEGRIDVLVAGIGTGGTISGVARYLKEQDPSIRVVAVDIEGSVFTEHFRTGRVGRAKPYCVEGLGDEEIIACPEWELLDDIVQVSDREAFLATRELALGEAMLTGGSSGAALWGVRQVAAEFDDSSRVVTIFPDSGLRYLSTIFSDDWMRQRGFLD
jgi:cystathionine beta-synthase